MRIKTWLAILLFSLIAVTSFSKSEVTKKSKFGFTGSFSLPSVELVSNGDIVSTATSLSQPKISYKVGGVFYKGLTKSFFIQSGISYISQTINSRTQLNSGSLNTDQAANWLELPLALNYVVDPVAKTKVFFGLGLSIRKLVGSKSKIFLMPYPNDNSSPTFIFDNSEYISWNSFGSLNAGIEIPLKYNDSILLSVSVDRNLFGIIKPATYSASLGNYTLNSFDYRVTTVSLNLAYVAR